MEIIKLTEAAQEQAKSFQASSGSTKDGLRIAVIGGGCAGLKYKLGMDDIKEADFVYEYPNGLRVIVDPKSATLLEGAGLEYHNGFDKSGFEVTNPNATNSCGCGKSFS